MAKRKSSKVVETKKDIELTKRFWVLVGLTALGLVITGISVVDGNRATTFVVAALTIMFAGALIHEAFN